MMLFGAEQDETLPDSFRLWGYEMVRTGTCLVWGSRGPVSPWIAVSCTTRFDGDSQWNIGVQWEDGTIIHGFGPTFAAAKRDCVRMLSERSREVGRV